jgi:hypothetical protein
VNAHKDYSGTPLSQKLGAKAGAGVVVYFTTSRTELERRFDVLKGSLDPADRYRICVAEEGRRDRERPDVRHRPE